MCVQRKPENKRSRASSWRSAFRTLPNSHQTLPLGMLRAFSCLFLASAGGKGRQRVASRQLFGWNLLRTSSAQSPESRPLKTKRSPAPAVHAASRAVRREPSCATPTSCSSLRTGAPPRSYGPGNATRPFPSAASRRLCRSWVGKRCRSPRLEDSSYPSSRGERALWDLYPEEAETTSSRASRLEICVQNPPQQPPDPSTWNAANLLVPVSRLSRRQRETARR
jgi:hypothetical protein